MTRVTIPQLDANLVDVTVTAWQRQPGETVRQGDILADLTTDKATFELEAPVAGVLLAVLAATKSVVPVGYIAALIGSIGECDPDVAADNAAVMAAYQPRATESAPRATPVVATAASVADTAASRIRATPKARRLAQAHGLDLARVQRETGAEIVTDAVLAPFLPGGAV